MTTTITVTYHKPSNTFIADDGHGNQTIYKVDRNSDPLAPISHGNALSPMVALLTACGACSGIDIVIILEKQREIFDSLAIHIAAEREQDVTPALWKKIHLSFSLSGDVSVEKAERAAVLSVDKYCSVLETLRRAGAVVSYDVKVN